MAMNKELEKIIEDLRYALGKFNWGASALDAKAIDILNTYTERLRELPKHFIPRSEVEREKQEYLDGFVELAKTKDFMNRDEKDQLFSGSCLEEMEKFAEQYKLKESENEQKTA